MEQFRSEKFGAYISGVAHATRCEGCQLCDKRRSLCCASEVCRLLDTGPPIWISDQDGAQPDPDGGLRLPDGDTHIAKFWYASDDTERSGKLDGALEGLERLALWDKLRQMHGLEPRGDETMGYHRQLPFTFATEEIPELPPSFLHGAAEEFPGRMPAELTALYTEVCEVFDRCVLAEPPD